MRSLLSCLQFGVGHHRSTSQSDNNEHHNSSGGEDTTRPASSEAQNAAGIGRTCVHEPIPVRSNSGDAGGNTIIVPQPRKPNTAVWSYWMNYMRMSTALVSNLSGVRSSSSESAEGEIKSEGASGPESAGGLYPRKLSKEERALKVQKYLEKKRNKSNMKKIRYQYRQQLAARRIRFQGRFVKAAEAKDLILKGAPVTAKDRTELNKLFEEDKDQELIKKYNENIRLHTVKPIFKMTHDTSVMDRLSGSEHSSYSSGSEGSSLGLGMSPLIETMKDIDLNGELKEQCAKIKLQPPPILKL